MDKQLFKISIDLLGKIPLDIGIRETSDNGRPIVISKSRSPHTLSYLTIAKTLLKNNLVLSSNSKILNDLSSGKGPSKFIFVIGYAGWRSNQLSEELKQNSWLVANMNKKILFSKNYKLKWKNAKN